MSWAVPSCHGFAFRGCFPQSRLFESWCKWFPWCRLSWQRFPLRCRSSCQGTCLLHVLLIYIDLFPTCQVRVVRFYQGCSPPPRLPPPPPLVSPRPCLHQLPPPLPPCQLFAKLFANSLRQALCQLPSSVCTGTSTWDLPSSLCTAQPQAQCAPLDLNQGPSQLSVHRWTSTWDLPSPVCTAGPQPGICPAQCAPLDLNRGPPQLSVHCWTSTGR